MNKEMYGVKVFTNNSDIIISQSGKVEIGDENRIVLHCDQIDTLTKWLNQAKYEMEQNNNNNNYYSTDAPF